MAVIVPWIDVKPSDFVQAAQGGARIGAELAGQRNEAGIAARRNQTALQEAQMRVNSEAAAQAEAAQNAAAQREMEKQIQQWQFQQQLKQQQNAIEGENFRNQNTITAENARAAAALGERQQYGGSMLDIRREANRIAQERADAAAAKPAPSDFTTVSEHTKEIPDIKKYSVNEPEIFNLFSKNTPGKTFDTTNATDLVNLPRGSVITTNTIPNTGSPARTISRRVPISVPPNPLEGRKVRDKVTGQTGMISNGQFVPDTQNQNQDGDAASM
jgi:rubrerythrin